MMAHFVWLLQALCAISLAVSTTDFVFAQQTVGSTNSLQTMQLQARSALLPSAQPNIIEFDGTFQAETGSEPESGTVHLTVGSDGSYTFASSKTTGAIVESRTVTNGLPACTWTDRENAVHNSSLRNCLAPAWFFPGLALLSPITSAAAPAWKPASYSSDSQGNHLHLQFAVPMAAGAQEDPQLLSPIELVLALDTNLPLYAIFTVHPDNPGFEADIPVKVAYSDYRNISGAMIPFHIQRYVNGHLALELTITTASVQ